jgi:small membrane protein
MIKFLLLAALVLVGYYAVRGSRRAIDRVVWRAFVCLALAAAAFSVVFPNALTWVANRVGVGRGADLLLYLVTVAFMLVSVVLFRRLADLERRYVTLARTLAIREARGEEADAGTGSDATLGSRSKGAS